MMNFALLRKAIFDCWLQLLLSCLALALFAWFYAWLVAQLPIGAFGTMLRWMPDLFKPMLGAPVGKLATPAGQLSILFVHVITVLICIGWAVGRGSDPITGEISRGTMDLIVSLPVRRPSLLVPPAVVAAAGSALLAASLWCGIVLGARTVDFGEEVSPWRFLPGVVNLFAMIFCLTGITTFFSSFARDRWRVVAGGAGFYVVSLIVKMAARLWPPNWPEGWDVSKWLNYVTFLSLFQPQELILMDRGAWATSLNYDLKLVLLGLIAYGLAAAAFWWRDIPAAR
jgi:ABC-2 type transport system permease protein